ncbi:hypothetical protein HON86_03075 [Candidatus Woesearchaeota archaeon]|nr:hypothetical protein [Candidatus Woesearchaeota archaeon]MBT4835572.1 hypothetical protein [Candidatus Woesearchaeota archaeon]MBT6734938.1 hypothetical protein [Candidatus Woesearchaeota archaeon]MBT7169765.1 hypothetical protein [Candidatus Woesearchaeota archaeon]MBT7474429.1 hypothetical protein [Candidatus Woesearchaeota archaeon]
MTIVDCDTRNRILMESDSAPSGRTLLNASYALANGSEVGCAFRNNKWLTYTSDSLGSLEKYFDLKTVRHTHPMADASTDGAEFENLAPSSDDLILSLLDSVEKPIFNTIYTVAPNEINPVLIGYRPFESGYANLNSPYYDDKDISFDVYWRAIGTSDMGHSMMTKEFIEDELHHCLHSWLINRGY